MATNVLDKLYLSQSQLDSLANGNSLTLGSDTYTADETALYLTPDTSLSYESQSLTSEQKTQAKANIEAASKTLTGSTDPTTTTVGEIGQLYINITNNTTYQCTAIISGTPNTYTWNQLAKSVTPTSANNIALLDATGNLADSEKAFETTLTSSSDAVIPTSKAIATFVNSSIATATAEFQGTYHVIDDLGLTATANNSDIAAKLNIAPDTAGAVVSKIDNTKKLNQLSDTNDYVFIQIGASGSNITEVRRFKYSANSWAFEYQLNNSGFTSAQWAAINSGIDSTKVGYLSSKAAAQDGTDLSLVTTGEKAAWYNKQDALVFNTAYNATTNKVATMSDLPTVNNSTITLQKNGSTVDTFTTNASSAKTVNFTISYSDVGFAMSDVSVMEVN